MQSIQLHSVLVQETATALKIRTARLTNPRPTIRPLEEVIAAFNNLSKPISNNTAFNDFLSTYFGEAGSELAPVPSDDLEIDPVFLDNVESEDVRSFLRQVIDIWPDLTRKYVGAGNCTGCVSSFIPLNRTFVVAGGRFREPYYWDSFWVIEGLLRTGGSFTQIALNIIENFLDLVEQFGFVPNGARVYYLNRSQPPLLTQMVRIYVEYTNDTSVLERVLPTLEKEYDFWSKNRTVDVEVDGETYTLNHYAVLNNQPRPESYREDYETATNTSYYSESGIIYPAMNLTNDEIAQLYSDLASGAESGWDYSSRWIANLADAVEDVYFPLRSLSTANIVPVDLNSILYANEITIANFLNLTGNSTGAEAWEELAARRSEAMAAVMWNVEYWSFFDYNLTAGEQHIFALADEDASISELEGAPEGYQVHLTPAQFYPFWTGAAPNYIKENPAVITRAYERIALQLELFDGALPASNIETGQQWDEPNVWPPLVYILIQGLLNTPATFGESDPLYQWTQELALNLTQRYLDSAFCTWRVTGGSTPNFPKLDGLDEDAIGTIFEKYDSTTTNAAGGGGEYEVVEGFGWSNGVLIWAGDVFGQQLQTPQCGNITAADVEPGRKKRSAMMISKRDAAWIESMKRSS
jgi:alpha,alpha-trehalase